MRKTPEKMRNLQKMLDSMNTNRGDDVDVQFFEGNGGKGAKGKGKVIPPRELCNSSTSASSSTSANPATKGQGKVIPPRPCQRAELTHLQDSECESVTEQAVVDEIRTLENSDAFSGSTGLPYIQVDLYICVYRVVLYIYINTYIYIYIHIYIYELTYY
jgi:hypothetical protein